jgi:hypothetical protein
MPINFDQVDPIIGFMQETSNQLQNEIAREQLAGWFFLRSENDLCILNIRDKSFQNLYFTSDLDSIRKQEKSKIHILLLPQWTLRN